MPLTHGLVTREERQQCVHELPECMIGTIDQQRLARRGQRRGRKFCLERGLAPVFTAGLAAALSDLRSAGVLESGATLERDIPLPSERSALQDWLAPPASSNAILHTFLTKLLIKCIYWVRIGAKSDGRTS